MTPEEQREFRDKMFNDIQQKMLDLRTQEQEFKKKKLKLRSWYLIAELVITLVAYAILGYQNGWILFGVVLASIGNNLGILRTLYEDKPNIWKEIWTSKK